MKWKCNLCPMYFHSTDDLFDRRIERHEEWHAKSSYFGTSKNMIRGKVKWEVTE